MPDFTTPQTERGVSRNTWDQELYADLALATFRQETAAQTTLAPNATTTYSFTLPIPIASRVELMAELHVAWAPLAGAQNVDARWLIGSSSGPLTGFGRSTRFVNTTTITGGDTFENELVVTALPNIPAGLQKFTLLITAGGGVPNVNVSNVALYARRATVPPSTNL